MAVHLIKTRNSYIVLSSDTKPIAGVPLGSTCFESDTLATFVLGYSSTGATGPSWIMGQTGTIFQG